MSSGNDMYVYCEIMDQLEPQSVLDVGMFLQSVGAVARHLLDREIAVDSEITGVQVGDKTFPVYEKIYNSVISMQEFENKQRRNPYKLGILLLERAQMPKDISPVISYMREQCQYILCKMDYVAAMGNVTDAKLLRVEQDEYAILTV